MTGQPRLFQTRPTHDGPLLALEDHIRLSLQQAAVLHLMSDHAWRQLKTIAQAVVAPEASVSARLRDLRKPKFGGFTVERRGLGRGVYVYRVV